MSELGEFQRLLPRIGYDAAKRLKLHWQLVCQWQATTNLTGIRSEQEAVRVHYEDAMVALPHWPENSRLVDVGSGAGFPGLVLAALRPESEVLLLEPRRLRLAFLREAKEALGLSRVRIVPGTLASVASLQAQCMTMRAVFSQDEQLDACASHLVSTGVLLVFRQGSKHRERTPTRLVCKERHSYRLADHAHLRSLDEWRLRSAKVR